LRTRIEREVISISSSSSMNSTASSSVSLMEG